jgi:hypothetical protein
MRKGNKLTSWKIERENKVRGRHPELAQLVIELGKMMIKPIKKSALLH